MENSTLQWIFGVGPQKMLINTIHLRSFNKAHFFSKIFLNCHSNINFHQALQAFSFLVVGSLYLNNLYFKKNTHLLWGEGNRSLWWSQRSSPRSIPLIFLNDCIPPSNLFHQSRPQTRLSPRTRRGQRGQNRTRLMGKMWQKTNEDDEYTRELYGSECFWHRFLTI